MSDAPPPSPDVDPGLLARAKTGDEAAFGQLMRSHHDAVFRLIYSIVRNEHDSRDISQEVWLTVWRQLPRFRGDSRFSTWVHPIAVRRSLDHLRRRRRWYSRFLPLSQPAEPDGPTPEPPAGVDVRQDAERDERLERFRRALDALPPKLRAVLALREVEGLSYDEIAAAARIPTGTVMSRLHHARRLLAQKLGANP